jgi:hypothetical protein
MEVMLAIFGGILGLAVTGASLYTAWAVRQLVKERGGTPGDRAALTAKLFLHWTVYDAAVIALFVCGTLLLIADAIGMLRDRQNYPLFHFGYLLCGIAFSVLGMAFVLIRLAAVLQAGHRSAASAPQRERLAGGDAGSATPNEHDEP